MFNQKPLPYFAAHLKFGNNDYFISFFCPNKNVLKIEVRDSDTVEEWHATFTAEYIEELTRKTGNFKTFDVFLAMLFSVISNKSNTLVLDLVDYKELESLRLSKQKKASSLGSKEQFECSQRRYLILTYMTDFDRTFYPLPLSYCGIQDSKKLLLLINKLRESLYNGCGPQKLTLSADENYNSNCDFENKIVKLEKERDMALARVQQFKSILKALHTDDSNENQSSMIRKLLGFPKSGEESNSYEICKLKKYISPYCQSIIRKNTPCKKGSNEISRNHYSQDRNIAGAAPFLRSTKMNSRSRSFSFSQRACSRGNEQNSRIQRSNTDNTFRPWRQNQHSSHDTASEDGDRLSAHLLPIRIPKRTRSADNIRRNSSSLGKFDPTVYVQEKQRQRKDSAERKKQGIRRVARRYTSPGAVSSSSELQIGAKATCNSQPRKDTLLTAIENVSNSPSMGSLYSRSYLREQKPNLARSNTNRSHRSPHSRRLLNRAGILLSDSESEGVLYPPPSKHISHRQKTQRRKPFQLDSTLSSGSEISLTPARQSSQKNNAHKIKLHQPRMLRDTSVISIGQDSSAQNSDMHEELNEMDERLDALQGFLANYFKKPTTV